MSKPTNSKKNNSLFMAGTALLTLISAAVEFTGFYLYLTAEVLVGEYLLFHLVVVGGLTIWLGVLIRIRQDIKLAGLILIMTTVTGVFGSLISVLTLGFYFIFSKDTISFLQWISVLFPEETVEKNIELYQRLSSGWDDFSDKKRIMSFQDAIALGTIPQKREALAKISRYYRREFAPALMSALHDANNAIRVQAATVIAKFEQEYMSRYMALARRYEEEPDNAAILLKLAQQADAYAYSGILDKEREMSFRHIAAEKYQTYIGLGISDNSASFALGRLYIHLGEAEKAYEILNDYIRSASKPPLNLIMWFIESLYALNRYDEMILLLNDYEDELAADISVPLVIKDTLRLWVQGVASDKLEIKTTDDR